MWRWLRRVRLWLHWREPTMLIVLLVVACGNILWLAQWKLSSSSSAATAPLAPAAPQPPAAGRGADPANRGRSAPQQQQQQPLQNLQQPPAPPETQPAAEPLKVEVWGKAAISDYFWYHIFEAETEKMMGGVWRRGFADCGKELSITFRTGFGVQHEMVPKDAEYVVLIINAHNDFKLPVAKTWVELLYQLPNLKSAGIIMLGQESCENEWLQPHLDDPRSKIDFVFLVYGGPMVDNKRVFQWPLGVATYRNFWLELDEVKKKSTQPRALLCNFMGTVYQGSSRETLMEVLNANANIASRCKLNPRDTWMRQETAQTAAEYKNALLDSEYTLCPAGQNTECYRWYEAAAAGSVPVVEDVVKPATCVRDPLSLLKADGAPFLYIKDWHELPAMMERQLSLSDRERAEQRAKVLDWYTGYKRRTRERFCSVAAKAFRAAEHRTNR